MYEYGREEMEQVIPEPPWTYESLDLELHHKGHGQIMDSRKVGAHTYLKRRGEDIAVKLHATDILTYYPDNRVVINASTWETVTTKDRMNAFLGWGTITSVQGSWHANVRFHVKHRFETRWGFQREGYALVSALIPFSNLMCLDVRTHELVSHPDEVFSRVDDSLVLREASDMSRRLRAQATMLTQKIESNTLIKSDIVFALQVLEKFQDERRRVADQVHSLESSMDWSSTTLEEVLTKAMSFHAKDASPEDEDE